MSDIADRVKKIVVEHLGVEEDKVTQTASFIDDLGADSLDTVELIMAFEEEFGAEIPDEDAEKLRTVGDAVRIVLSPTGYALANGRFTDPMQPTLLALQLPYVQRDLRAATAIEALVLLAGPGYRLMVDHVHRQVGFEVRPRFANYSHTDTTPRPTRDIAKASAWNCRALAGKF